jgi:hypothetical protein
METVSITSHNQQKFIETIEASIVNFWRKHPYPRLTDPATAKASRLVIQGPDKLLSPRRQTLSLSFLATPRKSGAPSFLSAFNVHLLQVRLAHSPKGLQWTQPYLILSSPEYRTSLHVTRSQCQYHKSQRFTKDCLWQTTTHSLMLQY